LINSYKQLPPHGDNDSPKGQVGVNSGYRKAASTCCDTRSQLNAYKLAATWYGCRSSSGTVKCPRR
jgi:hypothetical protein